MASSSLLVVASLQMLVALVAVLLVVFVVRQHRATGASLRDTARKAFAKIHGPLQFLGIAGALLVGADVLLPPERLHTEVYHQQQTDQATVNVTYGICCTGGGIASCEVSGLPAFAPQQPILVERSRILDRCTVEPVPSAPGPCKCS